MSVNRDTGAETVVVEDDGTLNVGDVSAVDLTATGNIQLGNTAGDTLDLQALTTVATDQKIQFRDTGIYLQSSSDGVLDIVSDTTVAVSGAVTMDSTLDVTGVITAGAKINLYPIGSASESASGLLMGVGTTANPALTTGADDKFVEIRAKTTAATGDNRLAYLRYEIGAAGGGECIRAFTKLTGDASTVRGAHISLDIDGGSASGLGVGVDGQILLGDAALTGGTYAVANFEAYSAGASTDVSGVTEFDIFRVSLGGDATGAATVDAKANLFNFSGVTAGSGNLINTDITTHTAYAGIPINIGGTVKYIPVVND